MPRDLGLCSSSSVSCFCCQCPLQLSPKNPTAPGHSQALLPAPGNQKGTGAVLGTSPHSCHKEELPWGKEEQQSTVGSLR